MLLRERELTYECKCADHDRLMLRVVWCALQLHLWVGKASRAIKNDHKRWRDSIVDRLSEAARAGNIREIWNLSRQLAGLPLRKGGRRAPLIPRPTLRRIGFSISKRSSMLVRALRSPALELRSLRSSTSACSLKRSREGKHCYKPSGACRTIERRAGDACQLSCG